MKTIIPIMCFDYEFPELEKEKDLIKSINQKKNLETEKLEKLEEQITMAA
jgi:hypothetical protein